MALNAKMNMPDSQLRPWNPYLINNVLDIVVFLGFYANYVWSSNNRLKSTVLNRSWHLCMEGHLKYCLPTYSVQHLLKYLYTVHCTLKLYNETVLLNSLIFFNVSTKILEFYVFTFKTLMPNLDHRENRWKNYKGVY